LIELMGGCCGVESVPGTGSRFWFEVTLPVAMMPLTASGLTGEPETAPIPVRLYGQAVRVLVVDDVYANRALLQQVLLRQGYEVTMADSGAGAVEAVRRGGFDVVLMDLQMPGMDGLAATAAIRASKTAGWNVPIVAITASNSPQEIARCLASGMQDCLTKPFDFGRSFRWAG
jgi:CheY-like chemotaxis protein